MRGGGGDKSTRIVTTETAKRINGAACALWFYQQGIIGRISTEVVWLIQSVSVAQIQAASEVIEAMNAEAPSVNGKRKLYQTLDPAGAEKLKAYADSLAL